MGNIIQIMQMLIGKYKSENIFFEIFLNVLICVSLMKFRVALTHGKPLYHIVINPLFCPEKAGLFSTSFKVGWMKKKQRILQSWPLK